MSNNGFNYGWICPKCGNVYSPNMTECTKCNFKDKADYYKPEVTFYSMEGQHNVENK